jgi:hypothetical protein
VQVVKKPLLLKRPRVSFLLFLKGILALLIAGPCESTADHDLNGSGGHQQLEFFTGGYDAAYISNVLRSKILGILMNKLAALYDLNPQFNF